MSRVFLFTGCPDHQLIILSRKKQIVDQISVLNADFKSAGLSFVLADYKYVKNATWFTTAAPDPPEVYVFLFFW